LGGGGVGSAAPVNSMVLHPSVSKQSFNFNVYRILSFKALFGVK